MIRVAAVAAFFARDRLPRAAALLAGGLALLLPRVLGAGAGPRSEGFSDGLAAAGGTGVTAGLFGLVLLAGVALLWQGIVSAEVESGRFRTSLSRPVPATGLFLARHGAALVLLAAAAGADAVVLRLAGGPAVADPTGALLCALLTGWALGGLMLLLSSLLDRAEVLAAVALVLAPGALDGIRLPQGPLGAAAGAVGAALPPVAGLRDARHLLMAGSAPDLADVTAVLLYGAAAVVLALLRLRTREYRAG